jgi:hypothetical protein
MMSFYTDEINRLKCSLHSVEYTTRRKKERKKKKTRKRSSDRKKKRMQQSFIVEF